MSFARKFSAIRKVDVVALIVFVAILAALLLPVPKIGVSTGSNLRCRKNFKQLWMALENYHDIHGIYPPAVIYGPDGKPWHSWRVMILPQLDQPALGREYRFDEPWDGPHNRTLFDRMPPVFHCESDKNAAVGTTSYVAVTGGRTLSTGAEVGRFGNDPEGLSQSRQDAKEWQAIRLARAGEECEVVTARPADTGLTHTR